MSGAGAGAGAEEARQRVLVVDDEPDVRKLVARALAEDYEVCEASSGLDATRILRDGCFMPDLIITDVMMPTMDGFSFMRLIRAKTQFARIPFIFLTARNTPADVIQGINIGARHYIQKPFSIKDLQDKVKKSLRRR